MRLENINKQHKNLGGFGLVKISSLSIGSNVNEIPTIILFLFGTQAGGGWAGGCMGV